MAFVVALPSVTYPLGRDQAVFWYVAREWLERGAVVYKDVFDHKTPGIYVVNVAAMALFGENPWAIRCLEIPVVFAIGWMATSIARSRLQGDWPPGLYGLGMLGASILHFGFQDFWNTAQCEIWCVFFTLAALLALGVGRAGPRRAAAAGLLAGCALLMKPTSLPLVCVVGAVLWRSARSARSARLGELGAFVAASTVPSLLSAAYLARRGAMHETVEILWSANARYVAAAGWGGPTDSFSRVVDVVRAYLPLSLVLAYGTVIGWISARKRGDAPWRSFYALVMALGVAGLFGVLVERKLYFYHFELMTTGGALAVVGLARQAWTYLASRGFAPIARSCIVGVHLVGLFALSWVGEHYWARVARDALLLKVGAIDRAQFATDFKVQVSRFDEASNEEVAAWIRARAAPGDELCVRGFDPEIYALTGLRCPSRFFWTWFLTDPHRASRREQWIAEDREALERGRPRFVVTLADAQDPIERESTFTGMGYLRAATFGEFLVLERSAGSP